MVILVTFPVTFFTRTRTDRVLERRISPKELTEAVCGRMGGVHQVRALRDGVLLVMCTTEKQRGGGDGQVGGKVVSGAKKTGVGSVGKCG